MRRTTEKSASSESIDDINASLSTLNITAKGLCQKSEIKKNEMVVPPLPPKKRTLSNQDKGQQKPISQGEIVKRHHQNYEVGKKAASSESTDDINSSLSTLKTTAEGLYKNSEIKSNGMEVLPLPHMKRAFSSTLDETSKVRSDVPRPVPLPRRKRLNWRANSTTSSQENIDNDSRDVMLQSEQEVDSRGFVQLQRTSSEDYDKEPSPELPPRPIFLLPLQIDSEEMESLLAREDDPPSLPPKKEKQRRRTSCKKEQAKKEKRPCLADDCPPPPPLLPKNDFCSGLAYSVVNVSDWRKMEQKWFGYTEVKDCVIIDHTYEEVENDKATKTEVKDGVIIDHTYEEVENDKATQGTPLESSERNNELLRPNEFAQNVDLAGSDDEGHYEDIESWLQTPPKVKFSSRRKPLDTTSRSFNSSENSNGRFKCSAETGYEQKDAFEMSLRKFTSRRKEQKDEEKVIPSARHFRNIGASKCFGKAGHKGARPIGWISSRNEEDFMDINDIGHYLKMKKKLHRALSKLEHFKKRLGQEEDLTKEKTTSLLNGNNRTDGTTRKPETRNDMKPNNGETEAPIEAPLTMSFKTLKQKTQNEPGIKDNFALKMVGEKEAQTLPSPIDNVSGKEASIDEETGKVASNDDNEYVEYFERSYVNQEILIKTDSGYQVNEPAQRKTHEDDVSGKKASVQEEIETGKLAPNDDNECVEYFERSYVNQEILIKRESSYQVKTGDDEQAQRKTYDDKEDTRIPYYNIVCVDSGSRYLHLEHFNDSYEDQVHHDIIMRSVST